MIIDCIGCLHGARPKLEGGDLLIMTGDYTKNDLEDQYFHFFDWVHEQQYRKKIMIAGNHDTLMEKEAYKGPQGIMLGAFEYLCDSGTEVTCYPYLDPANLENRGVPYKRKTLKIWGSPWTKKFHGMNPNCCAFTVDTEEELKQKWALIPDDTDILISHCPPYRTRDRTSDGRNVGSISLRNKSFHADIRLHAYSHVHEDQGTVTAHVRTSPKKALKTMYFLNCSIMNERYQPVNAPIRIVLSDKDFPNR